MATKKGIIITVGILVAITASSFLIWIIPQNNQNIFVVSDFETYLDNVKEIHDTLLLEIEEDFQKMLTAFYTICGYHSKKIRTWLYLGRSCEIYLTID